MLKITDVDHADNGNAKMILEWTPLDEKQKQTLINFAQHFDEELISHQLGLEHHRKRTCQSDKKEDIDNPMREWLSY